MAKLFVSLLSLALLLPACSPSHASFQTPTSTAIIASASAAPTSNPTIMPAATDVRANIDFNRLKNFTYLSLITGAATLENGEAQPEGKTIRLLDLHASGELDSDGQDDLAALIDEKYGGSDNIDLVVLLNKNNQPVEVAGEPLGDGTQVEALHIEKGQILVDTMAPSPVANDPCCSRFYRLAYQLSGQKLVVINQSTRSLDGKTRSIEIVPPLPAVISSDSIVIKGKLTTPPVNGKLLYGVIDSNGSEVASGESVIQNSETGDFSLPVDLSWVTAGPIRIEVRDVYSTGRVYAVLAFASVLVDFQPPARTVVPPLFFNLKMMDEQNGWALSSDRESVLHTANGGQSWQQSVFADKTALDLYALDALTAFVVSNLQGLPKNLYRSTDGGTTWTKLPTPFRNAFLQFGSANLVWAVVNPDCGAGSCIVDLFQTFDGGKIWQNMDMTALHGQESTLRPEQVRLQSSGGFSFISPETIWMGGNAIISENAIHLLVSHNGGRSWTSKKIRVPDGDKTSMVTYGRPIFTSPQDGYILASYSLPGSIKDTFEDITLLVTTHDGGETWKPSRLPTSDTNLNVQMFSTENILVWNTESAYQTMDAGLTWNPAGMNFSFMGRLAAMQFLSPQTGFALVNNHNPDAFSTDLYKTSDGGQTWQKVEVIITK